MSNPKPMAARIRISQCRNVSGCRPEGRSEDTRRLQVERTNTNTLMSLGRTWEKRLLSGYRSRVGMAIAPRWLLRRHDLQQFYRRLLVAVDQGKAAIRRPRAVEAEPLDHGGP